MPARAGIAIAVALTLTVLIVGLLAGRDPYRARDPKPKPAPAKADIDESDDLLHPPGEPAARAVARRFLSAFADYEIGAAGPQDRDMIAATTTRPLAASLLTRPPRIVRGVRLARHAQVAELSLAGVASGGALEYLTQLRRGDLVESFSLLLTPSQRAWRVARVSA